MSLLQIAEPNQSANPHQHRYALGIDLGTTRSMVAVVRSGKATVIPVSSTHAISSTRAKGADTVQQHTFNKPASDHKEVGGDNDINDGNNNDTIDGNDTTNNTIEANDTLLPSVVYYGTLVDENTSPIVGQRALAYLQRDPSNTIASSKRFMGRSIRDIKFSHPYTLKGADTDMPVFVTDQGDISPVVVAADILRTLYLRAQDSLPYNSIVGAVITVPAYFDEAQRQATKDAAKVAGIDVLRLINEPTAAAMAYGLDTIDDLQQQDNHQKDSHKHDTPTPSTTGRKVLIYDLGGGTFDVSILRLSQGVFEVLAIGGNSALGGDDIDRLVMAWLVKQTGADIKQLSTTSKSKVAQYAQQLKHQLTTADTVAVDMTITEDRADDNKANTHTNTYNWQGELTAQTLIKIIDPVTRRTLSSCEQVMRDAKLDKADLDDVILVGGSTRMPIIQQAVADFFAKTPLSYLNPDEVVALGAAQVANQLIRDNKSNNTLLLDVTPLSLGLETMGGLVEVLIPRNTPIPVTKRQIFTTYQDGQTGMVIHVVQGERETVENNRSLGRFELYGIPPMKAGVARIEVTFAIDTDGQLSVSAEETTTRTKSSIHIKPAYGLSEAQQEQLLQAGFTHAQEDKFARKLIETKVEAKRELLALASALQDYAELLTQDETSNLQSAMTQLSQVLDDTDMTPSAANKEDQTTPDSISQQDKHHADDTDYNLIFERIATAQSALKPLSDAFAARIMNQSVNKNLAGTRTSDWS